MALNYFKNFEQILFYCVDPGAYAMFREIMSKLKEQHFNGKMELYCEGWAETHAKEPFKPVSTLAQDLEDLKKNGIKALLVLGSQTNFSKTQFWIQYCQSYSMPTLFVFDHWKHYRDHFWNSEKNTLNLPDMIFVPDELAQSKLIEALSHDNSEVISDVETKVKVSQHYSIEKICEQVNKIDLKTLSMTQEKYSVKGKRLISLLLEPDVEDSTFNPGYTNETLLDGIANYLKQNRFEDAIVLVKPHPRQSIEKIENLLEKLWKEVGCRWEISKEDNLETVLGISDEVWGITTVALIAAKRLAKPIRSFQFNRNELGKAQSNDHLEPYLVI